MADDNLVDGPQDEATPVFVSYTHADREHAQLVVDFLESSGFEVWWDALIEGGSRFSQITEEKLEAASAVVVLWSENSVNSHWVRDEATRGRDRNCLVPVSIDGTEPPLGFRQILFIDISPAKKRLDHPSMQALLTAVKSAGAARNAPSLSALPGGAVGASGKLRINRRVAIGGGAVLAVSGLSFVGWKSGWLSGGKGDSVAVLPFETIGKNQQQRIFADGLAAEVRAQLSRNPLLRVAAQASSDSVSEQKGDARAISKALDVSYLLDGNVRIFENEVRVFAELIDGASGFAPWSQTFKTRLDDLFAIQSSIASAVIQALSAEIDGASSDDRGQVGGTKNIAAYQAFLQGKELFDAGIDEAGDRKALSLFEQAISLDPDYAAAYSARARSLALIGNLYASPAQRDALYDGAIAAARQAIALAPKFAEAHSVLGFAYVMGRLDMRAARAPYDKSYELGSGDADIASRYGIFASRIGKDHVAQEAISKAAILDPLNARSFRSAGDVAFAAGRYREALDKYQQARALNDSGRTNSYLIGLSKLMMGDLAGAKSSFEEEKFSVWRLTGGAIVEHRLGNSEAARQYLDTLKAQQGDKSSYQYLQIYAQWGQLDRALDAMHAAWKTKDSGLVQLYRDPLIEGVRKTDEYARLIDLMGFMG